MIEKYNGGKNTPFNDLGTTTCSIFLASVGDSFNWPPYILMAHKWDKLSISSGSNFVLSSITEGIKDEIV